MEKDRPSYTFHRTTGTSVIAPVFSLSPVLPPGLAPGPCPRVRWLKNRPLTSSTTSYNGRVPRIVTTRRDPSRPALLGAQPNPGRPPEEGTLGRRELVYRPYRWSGGAILGAASSAAGRSPPPACRVICALFVYPRVACECPLFLLFAPVVVCVCVLRVVQREGACGRVGSRVGAGSNHQVLSPTPDSYPSSSRTRPRPKHLPPCTQTGGARGW